MLKTALSLVTAIFMLSGIASAISVELPKTGQTTSYSAGDDGALQKGVSLPSPRFKDNSNGTVTDNLTGLMWFKNTNIAGAAKTWQEALDSVNVLDGSGIYGYSDWRLPNRRELRSLIDHSEFRPALPAGHPFENLPDMADPTTGSDFWSSTTDPYTFEFAWYADMYDGDVYVDAKTVSHFVWPVRGKTAVLPMTNQSRCYDSIGDWIDCSDFGQTQDALFGAYPPETSTEIGEIHVDPSSVAWPVPRFTDNGNGTVTDNLTGLLWPRNANLTGNATSWQEALDFITTMNNTNTYGRSDWRLPNINELESLINDNTVDARRTSTWLNTEGFENVQEYDYWTSTTDAMTNTDAWRVFMRTGYENAQDKTDPLYYAYVFPVTDSIIPAPAGQQSFQYASAKSAAKSTFAVSSKPVGVGAVAYGGNTVSLELSIGKFSSPVDVYLALYAPGIDPVNIYLIRSDYMLQPLFFGFVKFKENTTSVNERLFSDIPSSSLPSGNYQIYFLITPAGANMATGDISSYYLYETNFTIQ